MTTSLDQIVSDFEFLDDWEDRYRYIIELGRDMAPLDADEMTAATKVEGCASQVWLVSERGEDGRFRFRGDSDAMIVRGLVAIITTVFSGKTAAEIAQTDAEAVLTSLGLHEHLSTQRANGLRAMIGRIRAQAGV